MTNIKNKRFLAIPYSHALSHVTRLMEIAKELREHGGETIFGGCGKYLDIPRGEGFQIEDLIELDHQETMEKLSRLDFSDSPERIERFVKAELDLIERFKPDMVLSDCRITAGLSASIAQVRHAAVVNACWTQYYSAKIEVFQKDFFRKRIVEPLLPLILPWARPLAARDICRPYNKVLKKHQQTKIKHVNLGNTLTFIAEVPEFAPVKNQPANMHYIGPLVWQPNKDFAQEIKLPNPEHQTIYITWGSTGPENLRRFYESCCKEFSSRPVNVIVTTGGQLPREDWPEFPDNFLAAEYLPGDEVLELADVAICHSGSGTIYQALRHATPMVAVPVNNEQRMHSQRLRQLGLGLILDYEEIMGEPAMMSRAIETIMTTPSYHKNAKAFSKLVKKWNAPREAVKLIDEVLE